MRMPHPGYSPIVASPQPRLKGAQHENASGSGEAPRGVQDELRRPGHPLDAATRAFFEPRFGRDFSHVRLHADASAAASAKSLNALAYTVGPDIVFDSGRNGPATESGRRILAHELTHVVQQGGGARTLRRKGDIDSIPKILPCPVGTDIGFETEALLFENDVAALTPAQKARLDAFAASWHQRSDAPTVRIDGFASEPGTDEHNWALSCSRAVAVQQELESPTDTNVNSIPSGSLRKFMHGQTTTFGAEAQNRRVQLFVPNPPAKKTEPPPPETKQAPGKPATPTAKTKDCDSSQSDLISAALSKARSNIAAVLPALSASPLTPDLQNALWLYFRDSSAGTAQKVAENLRKIETKLSGISYECENDCQDDDKGTLMGYTRLGTMVTGLGSIHLCMNNLKPNADAVARTMTHEAAHFVLLATDTGGYYDSDCSESEQTVTGGPLTKLDTADSYCCFVENWQAKSAAQRTQAKKDLTGDNIAGIKQSPPGPIDLNGTHKKPIFTMLFDRGPLAMIAGVSYRWVFRDEQGRSYQMTDSDGQSLFETKPSLLSALAIFNQPTRDLLKQRGVTGGKVVCRATSPLFQDKVFEVAVTFLPR